MPQSLSRLFVHLVFSTKHRERRLMQTVRQPLHSYMGTLLSNMDCQAVLINSLDDHVHILMELARTISVSDAVAKVKASSSQWLKTQSSDFAQFAWQAGYGAFSVSESNVQAVTDYIAHQAEHHREVPFQDEYRAFMKKHGVAFDERYVWD